jgi:hypothetical protein
MVATHVHLLLNHMPPVGVLVAGLLFVIASGTRIVPLQRFSLALLAAFAVMAVPVYFTGESAEQLTRHLVGVSQPMVEQHEEAAVVALITMEFLGAGALLGLVLLWREMALPGSFTVGLVILLVFTTGLFGWTGYLGGQIRHPEIRAESSGEH